MGLNRFAPPVGRVFCIGCALTIAAWAALTGPPASAADPAVAANVASPLRQIDDARVRAAGIRKLSSRRLTLYTDLPAEQSVDELPAVFDLAFPQWCAYFHIDPAQHDDWRMTGNLMKDKLRFVAAGLLPADMPPFLNGYTRQSEFWAYDQSSPYYRRHLLLHEGTHGFMYALLGNVGPPWYAEGMAELLGTHLWRDGRLTLGNFPARPQDVPKLGRIEIIQTEFAARRAMRLTDVLNFGPQAHLNVEPYAWSWAAAAFLDNHPRYRQRFRSLPKFVTDADFNRHFAETFAGDGAQLAEEWQVFVADIAFGYDFNRTQLDFTPGTKLPARGAKVTVAADRGWQNSGLRLEAGKTYDLQAKGRYQVNKAPRVWWCEPNGVSIRYIHRKPLGQLLAAVRPDDTTVATTPLATPLPVGLGTVVRPSHSGTLYLRVNISDGELNAAAGSLSVHVAPN
jgi:hypothetical protein